MGCNHSTKTEVVESNHKLIGTNSSIYAGSFFKVQSLAFQKVYDIAELIVEGPINEIRVCVHKATQQRRAVKVTRKALQASNRDIILGEVEVLKHLDHPNIVRIQHLFEDDKRFYIVTGPLKGQGLLDEILTRGNFTEADAGIVMQQLLSAVYYLHSNQIVHRDLRPDVFLLDSESLHLVLYDLGKAASVRSTVQLTEIIGSAYHIAPEVLMETEPYCVKSDLWSCGVILYILMSGSPPFNGKTDEDIKNSIVKGNYAMTAPVWESVTEAAKSLIRGLLCFPTIERLTTSQALAHPWMELHRLQSLGRTNLPAVLRNLESFRNSVKLKDSVRTFITTMLLTSQDTEEMRLAFAALDKNHDGKLSREELLEEYTAIRGHEAGLIEVERIFAKVDTDKSGYIDYTEFLKATVERSKLVSASKVERTFEEFSTRARGSITRDEINRILQKTYANEEWETALAEVEARRVPS